MTARGEPAESVILPRSLLVAAGVLIGLTIGGITLVGRPGGNVAPAAGVAVVQSVDLRFLDAADGSIVVQQVAPRPGAEVLAPGSNGFIRGALRGLARERHRRGLGSDVPMRLTAWADGALTLEDLATRERIEVNSFGSANVAAFRALLPRSP
jgi:putative photosynthetic complex assembly protein